MGCALEAGAARMAETALRTNGGFPAMLRLPAPATSGDDAEQLGLSAAMFEDLPVGVGVWRRAGETTMLLLSASAVPELMGSRGFTTAEALFQAAAGAVVDSELYAIEDSEPIAVGGAPCGYRLTVTGPART